MKKIFKGVLITGGVLVGGLVVFLAVAATRPSHFSVGRSATIAAKPEEVFSFVNSLAEFQKWSPWARRDPSMKSTFAGPKSGVGSEYHWVGNSEVGEGNMKITESTAGELVRMQLDFIKPFAASNKVDFIFEPAGNGTKVKWVMSGENGLMGKAIGMLMNMDKMVGGDFEQGLANLKGLAESKGKVNPS